MNALSVILPTAMPVFVVAFLGYLLARAGRPFDDKTVTFIVVNVGAPALIFFQLTTTTLAPDNIGRIAAATALAIAANLVVGGLVLKASGLSFRTYLPALAFPNTGNLGLPLALYAAGPDGLSCAVVVFSTMSIANLTAGQAIAAGRAQWGAVIKNPILPAVALGLLFSFAGLELPTWAVNTLHLLSSLTIPLMLLMLGTACAKIGDAEARAGFVRTLSTAPRAATSSHDNDNDNDDDGDGDDDERQARKQTFTMQRQRRITIARRTVGLAALRLALGITAGFVISDLFAFEGVLRTVFILQCAMPVAVYNYVFAQKYGNEPEAVASLVVISTLFSMGTTLALLVLLAVD